MPVVPSCLLEPIWGEFCVLLGDQRPEFDPAHPLDCHRRRIPDRVVFKHVVAALVHGSGYERIASPGCSDRTIRRRVKAWAAAGIGAQAPHLGHLPAPARKTHTRGIPHRPLPGTHASRDLVALAWRHLVAHVTVRIVRCRFTPSG